LVKSIIFLDSYKETLMLSNASVTLTASSSMRVVSLGQT